MSPLRDFLIARRPTDVTARPPARTARLPWRRPAARTPSATWTPSIGVLAQPRDLAAAAAAAGLALARGGSAALVCVRAPASADPHAPGPRAPARAAAARLAASLHVRGLAAEPRGRLVLVALPHDPAECTSAAARALAAAGAAPTVLAVAGRDDDV